MSCSNSAAAITWTRTDMQHDDPDIMQLAQQMLDIDEPEELVTCMQNDLMAAHDRDGVAMLGTLAGLVYTTIMATATSNDKGLEGANKLVEAFHLVLTSAVSDINADIKPKLRH